MAHNSDDGVSTGSTTFTFEVQEAMANNKYPMMRNLAFMPAKV
jgi:hypothetical protein